MDINSLLKTLGGAVAESGAVNSWCTANYGQGVSVFESLDMRLLESADACPLVVLHANGKSGGPGKDKRIHFIAAEVLVHDGTRFTDDNGVHVFRGGRNVEVLRQIVFDVLKDSIPVNCKLDAVETEYDTVDQFPFFWTGMQLTVSQENLIGQDPFE